MVRTLLTLLLVGTMLVPQGVCVCGFDRCDLAGSVGEPAPHCPHHDADGDHPDGGSPSHDDPHTPGCPALNATDRATADAQSAPVPEGVASGVFLADAVVESVPSHSPVASIRAHDRPAYITFRALLI